MERMEYDHVDGICNLPFVRPSKELLAKRLKLRTLSLSGQLERDNYHLAAIFVARIDNLFPRTRNLKVITIKLLVLSVGG